MVDSYHLFNLLEVTRVTNLPTIPKRLTCHNIVYNRHWRASTYKLSVTLIAKAKNILYSYMYIVY